MFLHASLEVYRFCVAQIPNVISADCERQWSVASVYLCDKFLMCSVYWQLFPFSLLCARWSKRDKMMTRRRDRKTNTNRAWLNWPFLFCANEMVQTNLGNTNKKKGTRIIWSITVFLQTSHHRRKYLVFSFIVSDTNIWFQFSVVFEFLGGFTQGAGDRLYIAFTTGNKASLVSLDSYFALGTRIGRHCWVSLR